MMVVMMHAVDIHKTFDGVEVLSGIDLTINGGQIVHISGDNGSGKSTLFKILTHLLEPTKGKVSIADDAVKIGAIIENPSFLEFSTAWENLQFLGRLDNGFDAKYTEELLSRFSLDAHDRRPISKFSVGMREKVGIVQAIMEHQNLVFLDEPTRGLDKNSIQTLAAISAEIKNAGGSVVIASHDIVPEIDYDQKYLLEKGNIHHVA
ncbi:MAG: ABC transporter ATP-binding protein [Schleiferilactobacillus harbinensis]|jgi:ABC-2 type transport system ATP-binding protein|nr:ABC transporter ATP-binding protein [Schleiferilactobacillus harbinensis]MCI1913112.1 ABC transporter ATP-binding protein [Schleiferilactobacillus harbinensis]